MKIFIYALISFWTFSTWGSECSFNGRSLYILNEEKDYDVEFAIRMPFPLKLMETLEKHFGKFNKAQCKSALVAAKITRLSKNQIYYAFYTNQTSCDGGNSYGVVFKSTDKDGVSPVAIIEDSYLDCL